MCKCSCNAGVFLLQELIERKSLLLCLGQKPVGEVKVCINYWVQTAATANQPVYINQTKWLFERKTTLKNTVVLSLN